MRALARAAQAAGLRPFKPTYTPRRIGRPQGVKDSVPRGELRGAALLIHAAKMRAKTRLPKTQTEMLNIAAGLLRLKKRGAIYEVWIDANRIRVQDEEYGYAKPLTWQAAAALMEAGERAA